MAKAGPRHPRQSPAPRSNVVSLPRKAGPAPEDIARTAMAHEPTGASGTKVKLALTVYLSPGQAEKLTARAIREGKNLAALVAEILEAERR